MCVCVLFVTPTHTHAFEQTNFKFPPHACSPFFPQRIHVRKIRNKAEKLFLMENIFLTLSSVCNKVSYGNCGGCIHYFLALSILIFSELNWDLFTNKKKPHRICIFAEICENI